MAVALPLNGSITAAYLPLAPQPQSGIAQDAYDEAVSTLQKEFKGNKKGLAILFATNSIEDVRGIVVHAEREYNKEGKPRKKVLQWLHSFSIRIAHYERVLDTLAQHHPEYVSLAWGALKLVFTGIIDHHELVEKLSQSLADIGDILAQVKLTAELYQTERIKQAVALLYTCIIRYFVRVALWYKHRSATRLVLSFVSPFDVAFKETLEQIKHVANSINTLANQASQAEIRDAHGTIMDVHSTVHDVYGLTRDSRDTIEDIYGLLQDSHVLIKDTRGGMNAVDLRLQKLQHEVDHKIWCFEAKLDHILQVGIATKSLMEQPPVGVRDVHCFQQELFAQFSTSTDPAQILHKQQVLFKNRQRKPGYVFDVGSFMGSLKQWGTSPQSSLLVLQSGARANGASKRLAVELVTHIQSQSHEVLFSLSLPPFDAYVPSTETVLKSIVAQAIRNHSDVLPQLYDCFNFEKLNSSDSEREWLNLLSSILYKLGSCVIIIESEDLYRLSGSDPAWPLHFISAFRQLTESVGASGGIVKTLVVNFSARDPQLVDGLDGSPHLHGTVHRAPALPPRLKRTAAARSEKQRRSLQSLRLRG